MPIALKQFFQCVTSGPESVLSSYTLSDPRCLPGIPRIVEKLSQLSRDTARSVTMPRNRPGDPESGHPCGIVELVVGAGHDQHGTTGTHRQASRPNAAWVDNRGGPWKKLREGDVIARYDALREGCWPVSTVMADYEYRPSPEQFGGGSTVLEKLSDLQDRRRAEREHNWWRTCVEEANQLGRHPGFSALVKEREAADEGLRRPVRLFAGEPL